MKETDILVIGSGMAGLTVASLLAKDGFDITVLERNWLPGGCSSSYPRKNFWFESGATTIIGMDPGMPVRYLMEQLDIHIEMWALKTPMKVYLKNGEVLTRYQDLDQWIEEAERVFGKQGQREFWQYCYDISQFVWNTSLKQLAFPPSNFQDIVHTIKNFQPNQVYFARLAYQTVGDLLRKHGLDKNELFIDFINEQLVITAQNYLDEVNILFGATALSYTNYTNYYVPGGLIKLVEGLQKYIEDQGGKFELRNEVKSVKRENGSYKIEAKKGDYKSKYVVSSVPLNNTLDIFQDQSLDRKYRRQVMDSAQLNSAFSFGFAAKRLADFDCIHHQIHLTEPLPYINAKSIFLSLSHHQDHLRCEPGQIVGSVSTHIHDPANRFIEKKEEIENAIIDILEEKGFLRREDLLYTHSSTPKSWEKWTGRQWGFVGGYPQYFDIKPWQMVDSRLDGKGAFICGDSVYPGQGIPGTCLSGIIAWNKLQLSGISRKLKKGVDLAEAKTSLV